MFCNGHLTALDSLTFACCLKHGTSLNVGGQIRRQTHTVAVDWFDIWSAVQRNLTGSVIEQINNRTGPTSLHRGFTFDKHLNHWLTFFSASQPKFLNCSWSLSSDCEYEFNCSHPLLFCLAQYIICVVAGKRNEGIIIFWYEKQSFVRWYSFFSDKQLLLWTDNVLRGRRHHIFAWLGNSYTQHSCVIKPKYNNDTSMGFDLLKCWLATIKTWTLLFAFSV